MFGFKNSKKVPEPVTVEFEKPVFETVWTKEFVHTSNFRGFRRLSLVHNAIDECINTLALYRDGGFSFKGCPILLECVRKTYAGNSSDTINVYVDGHLIGRLPEYKEKEQSMLTDYEYDKLHLRVEESYHADGSVMGQNVYLMVHYVNEEPPR